MDLTKLAYPRHLHCVDGPSVIVKDADEAAKKVTEGYTLLPAGAEYGVVAADGSILSEAPERSVVADRVPPKAHR